MWLDAKATSIGGLVIRKILTVVVLQVATFSSLVGLYFTIIPIDQPRPNWHWMVLGASAIASLFLTAYEIRDHIKATPKTFRSQKKINRYMCRWVSSGGRVAIFSRDMSWANEEAVKSILLTKAANNELTVCLEKEIPLTNELKEKGARIVTYGGLGHVPRSRFTIVDFDKEGARVAVGAHLDGRHAIEEFRSGDHPFFAVAEDLVKLLLKAHERGVS
jgi:hypothetical protein